MRDGVKMRERVAVALRIGAEIGPVVGRDHGPIEGWDLVTDLELASLGESGGLPWVTSY